MADEKPNVFPNKDLIDAANKTGQDIANQFNNENQVVFKNEVSPAEQAAAEAMARKTAEQIAERERLLKIQEDRARQLDEERAKVMSQTRPVYPSQTPPPVVPPVIPPSTPSGYDLPPEMPKEVNKYIHLSQPQMNESFDVLTLPSEGKLYKTKKKAIKVAYLTAADENILTNPNLLESGEFLEILFNRKILEPELRYRDLHVGDRNAIMIWLRSTGYGHEYPITLLDPETLTEFESVIDLTSIKTNNLGAEPDKDGYFEFVLPVTKTTIKFKLLTVGDVDDIEEHVQKVKDTLGAEYIDTITYTLGKHIVEINGERDEKVISEFVQSMRVGDSNALRKYIDEIESGVDMRITVGTPGGGSLTTFLPLNLKFFWPNSRI
jgi:hypothetical protein